LRRGTAVIAGSACKGIPELRSGDFPASAGRRSAAGQTTISFCKGAKRNGFLDFPKKKALNMVPVYEERFWAGAQRRVDTFVVSCGCQGSAAW